MSKRAILNWFNFPRFQNNQNTKSITLVELMISLLVVGIMVLSFYSLETFSHQQVISAHRRVKLQGNLSFCLEHMSKYIQQSTGNINTLPIKLYPNEISPTGFQVNFDCKATPSDLTDDVWVYYALSDVDSDTKPELSVACSGTNCGTTTKCSEIPITPEVISRNIITGFSTGVLPEPLESGFSVYVDALGNFIDIGLVGRFDPDSPESAGTGGVINPQVEMKTKVICNSSSTN
jgi:Tfp pilus assembly protein PilE